MELDGNQYNIHLIETGSGSFPNERISLECMNCALNQIVEAFRMRASHSLPLGKFQNAENLKMYKITSTNANACAAHSIIRPKKINGKQTCIDAFN